MYIFFFLFFFIGLLFSHFKIPQTFLIFLKYKIFFNFFNLFIDKKKLNLINLKKKINTNSEFEALKFFLKKNYTNPKFSKNFVLESIGKNNYFIKSKIKTNNLIARYIINKNYVLKIYKSKLQNSFSFKWLEFYKKNIEIKKNLLFLHGNSCDPGEIFGLTKGFFKYPYQKFSDPVAFLFANNSTRLILPIKFNHYLENFLNKASLELSDVGLNINYIEQMKIFSLYNFFKKNVSIFGFSHGAWQALLSSQYLKFDELIYYDFLINPLEFNLKKGFYKNFRFGYKTIFDYANSFNKSKSKKITVMIGKKSIIYDKKFIKLTIPKLNKKKLNVIYYNDKHYISSKYIKKYLINEI